MTVKHQTNCHPKTTPDSVHSNSLPFYSQYIHPGAKVLLVNGLIVGGLIHQRIQLSRVRDLNLCNPALALRASIDGLGLIIEDNVTADDLARDGGEHVRSGLDRLNGPDGLASGNLKVGLGEFNIDNLAQGVGGVVGDTDLGCRARLEFLPFTCTRRRSQFVPKDELAQRKVTNQCCCRRRAQSIRATRCTSSTELETPIDGPVSNL